MKPGELRPSAFDTCHLMTLLVGNAGLLGLPAAPVSGVLGGMLLLRVLGVSLVLLLAGEVPVSFSAITITGGLWLMAAGGMFRSLTYLDIASMLVGFGLLVLGGLSLMRRRPVTRPTGEPGRWAGH